MQIVQPDFFIPAMLIGTVDFCYFHTAFKGENSADGIL